MKRIKYLLFTALLLVISLVRVNAANISVNANKSVTVGNSFKVNVKVSEAAGWEYCLSYDERYVSFVSAGSDTGGLCVKTGSTLTGYADVTFNFKAIAQGNAQFTINSGTAYDDDGNPLQTNRGSVTVNIVAQKEITSTENYSDNANLKSLEIVGHTLTPEFNPNTTTYSLEVENEVTSIAINAFRDDTNASISSSAANTDNIELTEGLNKITFTVTAQKGNRKVYTINVTRKEVNPIYVTVDGVKYTLVRELKDVEAPLLYSEGTVTIDDTEIPAYTSEATGYSLVVLKDDEGNAGLFRYNNGVYEKYVQLTTDNLVLIPENTREEIKGYTNKKEIVIDNNNVVVYSNGDNDFVLLYARNVKTGEFGWYKYDTKEGTFQRFDSKQVATGEKDIYFFLTLVFAFIALFAIIIMLMLYSVNKKVRRKNHKLIEKLKNKQVTVIEHPVFDTDIMRVDSWKNINDSKKKKEEEEVEEPTEEIEEVTEETMTDIIPEVTEEIPVEEEVPEEEPPKRRRKTPVLDEEAIEEVPVEIPEEEPKEEVKEEKLSKRELKKKEKEERKALEKELKEMREDFLNTLEVPTVDEDEIEVPDLDDLTDTQVMNLTDTQIMDFSKTQQLEIKKRRRKRKRKAKES
jgi:hypothetical protein